MYTVFFLPTANGYKILLMLEALAVSYDICHIHLAGDEQHLPAYLQVKPHAKISVLLDNDNQQVVVESATVLLYLAEKHARFGGTSPVQRWQLMQWLIWQVSTLIAKPRAAIGSSVAEPDNRLGCSRFPSAPARPTVACVSISSR